MKDKSKRRALLAACAIFFAIGFLGSSTGPVLPDLARKSGADLAALGSLFTVLFLGALITQTVTGAATDRLGHKPVLVLGLLLTSLGTAGIVSSNSLLLMIASGLVTGLGNGIIILSTNLFVAQVFASQSVAALNLSNVFYGVGAVTGPFLAGLFLASFNTALPSLWLGAAFVLLLVPFVLSLESSRLRAASTEPAAGSYEAGPVSVFASPVVWVFGLMLLVYVGAEVGMGGWLVTYMTHTTALARDTAALVTSAFYIALTGGRLAAGLTGRWLTGVRLLFVSLCGALTGGSILLASTGNVAVTIAGALVLGMFLGPVYPTVVGVVAAMFPLSSGKAASVVMVMGSTGGVVLPWLLGIVMLQISPRVGMGVIAGCAFSMLLLCVLAGSLSSRSSSRAASAGAALAKD